LGNEVIRAPDSGELPGLAARGARIEPGDTLVKVDPDGIADRCYDVNEGPRRIASGVRAALDEHRSYQERLVCHRAVTRGRDNGGSGYR